MISFLLKGGVVLLPILILSIASLAIIIERSIKYITIRENAPDLECQIIDHLKDREIEEVDQELRKRYSPEALVLYAGFKVRNGTLANIDRQMESQALRCTAELEKNVPHLSSIANLATLLGLLGTVTGMIISFINMQTSGISDPAVLAGGISQALITTAAGLTVAIPSLLFYNLFNQAVNRAVSRMEIAAAELASFFSGEKY
ncbi:MAG: MotA/TolQ/ExbB proton channel family protein [Spirochaeta sp.]|nr:MotA/TolQ/ExbB proton channel family protein [Spirochaeta sp.]